MEANAPASIDEYLAGCSPEVKEILTRLRAVIREAAPEATETISYRMPAFMMNGPLVYFAAFKNHIGFFPTPSGVEAFKDELSDYTWSKGTIQFPLDKPIPFDLVTRIVRFRIEENAKKTGRRK